MATQVQYIVTDDLDGGTDGVDTYRFALHGVEYEIDLSPPNISTFRNALQPFIAAARRQPTPKPTARRRVGAATGQSRKEQIYTRWAAHEQRRARRSAPAAVSPRTVREAHHAAR